MERYQSLRHILSDAREKSREIRFINGEKDESILPFSELWDRAVTLLGAFQSHGMRAGDELVIFTRSNESFVTAFWAAILGEPCCEPFLPTAEFVVGCGPDPCCGAPDCCGDCGGGFGCGAGDGGPSGAGIGPGATGAGPPTRTRVPSAC